MIYPYLLFCRDVELKPIIKLEGCPHHIVLDEELTQKALELKGDSERINDWFSEMIYDSGKTWAVGAYLENREAVLSKYPHMEEDKRYFHLGIDICAPAGTPIYTPLDGIVYDTGYEEGEGNYGGYVIMKYTVRDFEPFYTIYGHMRRGSLPDIGVMMKAGDVIAEIGDLHENGGWNHHTHIQVITEKGKDKGYFFKGYCNESVLKDVELLCPNPIPLLMGCKY